ncbi:hypothetical protein DL240_14830 [Lujinxingia litoralis]|uniref:Uncharacterized protein n=1 Tax=Lujinxingia litoralis TaxID=2211119 RepID=A0A328C2R5_9DELT|nr:hypothetical protein [Lujinxingia litoralis]RAL20945.1 hypothetical protein DL240_14830 [Lujinxingia litoralis]
MALLLAIGMVAGAWAFWSGARGTLPGLLTEQEGRQGKVGTLRALETMARARELAGLLASPRLDACDLGWQEGRVIRVRSTLKIRAEQGRLFRRWEEELQYTRREDGHGELVSRADVVDLSGESSTQQQRWTWSNEGAYEWLGESSAVAHSPISPALMRVQQEARGRFEALMRLTSPGWAPTAQGVLVPVPERDFRCGDEPVREFEDWASVLTARAELSEAQVTRRDHAGARCRKLEARFALRAGGEVSMELDECTQAMDDAPRWESPAEVVSLEAMREDRELVALLQQVRALVEDGDVVAGPGFAELKSEGQE